MDLLEIIFVHVIVSFILTRIIVRFLICWILQVKKRTSNDNSGYGSHVMQYGDLKLSLEDLFLYMGTNPANDNFTFVDENSLRPSSKTINQRDADLLHFWDKVPQPRLNALNWFDICIELVLYCDYNVLVVFKIAVLLLGKGVWYIQVIDVCF